MKCQKCGCENILKAKYCRQCGNSFSEEEKTKAYDQTIYGKLDKLSDLKDWATLDKITGSKIFKVGLLAVILLGGFLSGSRLKTLQILEGNDYTVEYNSQAKEYYLDTNESKIQLNLYVPKDYKNLTLRQFDANGSMIKEQDYKQDESLTLEASTANYYNIEAIYEDGEDENMTLFVY